MIITEPVAAPDNDKPRTPSPTSSRAAAAQEHSGSAPAAGSAQPKPVGLPAATYRLQFNKSFTFADARAIVPYLHQLGITHVYASPYFKAGPESMHGYDICDHRELNPVIGSREEYDAFVAELHAHGMGQIVDFVPNHMGIASTLNTWWMDVLENGRSSVHAPFFDIDWLPMKEQLESKVLLPILGDQYGRVLERGEFHLEFENGAFFLKYFAARFPIAPRSYELILRPVLARLAQMAVPEDTRLELESVLTAIQHLPERGELEAAKIAERAREKEIIKRRLLRRCDDCPTVRDAIEQTLREMEGRVGDARSFDPLDALLQRQVYRLSFWRVAAEEINYRRFFDVNELAAIRVELPEVFEATHQFVFDLVKVGAIQGLRIDHVDGLWDPREYLQKLRSRCAELVGPENPFYLVVEKILVGDERLAADWPIDGSTGYDFTNEVIGVLVDGAAEKSITDSYQRFTGEMARCEEVIYRSKRLTMQLSLASEINVLGRMLDRLSETNRWYRDFTLSALTTAVREVIACFPVYRTYITAQGEPDQADREAILRALRLAKRRNPGIERSIFNFLGETLLGKLPENVEPATRDEHKRFVLKFQQCSGPIMAKGVEDTAFYIYNRLIALNEVGGDPERFGLPVDEFFARCANRGSRYPHAMLATSTHDTKLAEDVRARIAAISEVPTIWRRLLSRWRESNERCKRQIDGEWAPSANEEYRLYQVLIGTWPVDRAIADAEYIQRIQEYMIKAIRESKMNSSWIQPQEEWEDAVRAFIAGILRPGRNPFLKDLRAFVQQIAELGAINSLSQTVLKCTVPGVPDVYQGCEFWSFSLVDPDNRRPVDYPAHQQLLDTLDQASPPELFANWTDGRIKCFLLRKLLRLRGEHPELFAHGEFLPVPVEGAYADSCLAFVRRHGSETLLVVVPRLSARVGTPSIGSRWKDTILRLAGVPGCDARMRDLFTGAELERKGLDALVAKALRDLPVAVYASF